MTEKLERIRQAIESYMNDVEPVQPQYVVFTEKVKGFEVGKAYQILESGIVGGNMVHLIFSAKGKSYYFSESMHKCIFTNDAEN